MPFTEDLTVFFDTTDFAYAATYTPTGGSATTVNGIFGKEFVDVGRADGYRPVFRCAASDVDADPQGDALVVNSVTYSIISYQPIDDGATVALVLHEA